jgi:hypothetical protein
MAIDFLGWGSSRFGCDLFVGSTSGISKMVGFEGSFFRCRKDRRANRKQHDASSFDYGWRDDPSAGRPAKSMERGRRKKLHVTNGDRLDIVGNRVLCDEQFEQLAP